jgi:hypothetical protein
VAHRCAGIVVRWHRRDVTIALTIATVVSEATIGNATRIADTVTYPILGAVVTSFLSVGAIAAVVGKATVCNAMQITDTVADPAVWAVCTGTRQLWAFAARRHTKPWHLTAIGVRSTWTQHIIRAAHSWAHRRTQETVDARDLHRHARPWHFTAIGIHSTIAHHIVGAARGLRMGWTWRRGPHGISNGIPLTVATVVSEATIGYAMRIADTVAYPMWWAVVTSFSSVGAITAVIGKATIGNAMRIADTVAYPAVWAMCTGICRCVWHRRRDVAAIIIAVTSARPCVAAPVATVNRPRSCHGNLGRLQVGCLMEFQTGLEERNVMCV